MGRLIGTDASVPVAASYPSHPITERFNLHHRLSAGALDDAGDRRRQRPHRAAFVETSPHSWAEADIKALLTTARSSLDEDKGDKKGPISHRRGRVGRRPTPADAAEAGRPDAPKPETRVVVIGDSDFAANGVPRYPGQPRPVHEHHRLAVAAGEPHLHPAQGSRRPARSR